MSTTTKASVPPLTTEAARLAEEAKRLSRQLSNSAYSQGVADERDSWKQQEKYDKQAREQLAALSETIDRLAALAQPSQPAGEGEVRKPLTEEQLFRLIEQSGVTYQKPVQQENRFTGEEETVYVMTEEFSEFKFARLVERAHGIGIPARSQEENGQ